MAKVVEMASLNEVSRTGLSAPDPEGLQAEPVGQQLMQLGLLTAQQVARVSVWRRQRGMNFAEAAVAMGVVRRDDLMAALSRQYSYPIMHRDADNTRFSQELVVGHEPFSQAAESIRSIRSSIAASAIAQGTRSFLVTGPRAGSGSTYFAGNLALSFAQMSLPTLLVDADLRAPRIAEMFGLERSVDGLSEVLRRKDIDRLPIVPDIIPGLSILPAGAVPPNPQELLCSVEFLALTNNLVNEYGVVVYDTAPANEFADAHVVAARVGAALVVARQHTTTFNDVSSLAGKLRGIQCKVLGTVLNTY